MNILKTASIFLLFFLNSCNALKITIEEKYFINQENYNTPFKVLTINNMNDSLSLRNRCKDVDIVKDKDIIQKFIARLDTTLKNENGVGIAASQVGIFRNIFLFTRFDKKNNPVECAINPRIVKYSDETFCFERDACLSIPKQKANTLRYKWVEVKYLNLKGETIREKLTGYSRKEDFTSIIFQHELDHLNGVLYIDRKL